MITLLSRLFIKDRENTSDAGVRRAYGMLCSLVGIGLNVLLFLGKYLAGRLSGSIAMTADAFNNLSDAGSSVITLLGFRMAAKKPDPLSPLHAGIEYLSGVAVSLIISRGVQLGLESIDKIRSPGTGGRRAPAHAGARRLHLHQGLHVRLQPRHRPEAELPRHVGHGDGSARTA
ncbi:MAG: cation diffusion facilitator family transporter [Oscillospiraceae bacterium]